MLEQTEKYFFPGSDPEPRLVAAARSLQTQGFETSRSALTVSGTSPSRGFGLQIRTHVTLSSAGAGVSMAVELKPVIARSWIAILVVSAIVLFPVAAILALLMRNRYQAEATEILTDLHTAVTAVTSIRPSAPRRISSEIRIRAPYVGRGDAKVGGHRR